MGGVIGEKFGGVEVFLVLFFCVCYDLGIVWIMWFFGVMWFIGGGRNDSYVFSFL